MFSKFLDPKNDVAFKKIFGSEKNKDILIHFLNDMVILKGNKPIVSVTFLKPSLDPETAAHKVSVVDILCKDEEDNLYVVEMQVTKDKGFAKRAQYYASKVYTSQMHTGERYAGLKEVIFLAIVDFVMFPEKKAYKSDHVILDRETYEHDLKDFSFTFLELPKFTKELSELTTMIDKWAYFFKHTATLSIEEALQLVDDDVIIERAYRELDRFRWNDQELMGYDEVEHQERVYYGALEQKFDEGMLKGMLKGQLEGELKAKKAIALTLLEKGCPLQLIAESTGFTLEEIDTIADPLYAEHNVN